MRTILAACFAVAMGGAAHAEVVEQSDAGFRIRNTVATAASPDRVYAALGEIGRWWDDAHTYSGQAANMTLRLESGACFCEALPQGGGVRHGVVALAWPDQSLLRLEAALGPLQDEGAAGALTFQARVKDGVTEIVQTYNVGGMTADRARRFAPLVDQVMRTQLERLGRYAATGAP
ncbi:MAG: ATPase [Phenylobacterium sp.]|uniref:ATPase n=1 Tax=Phenylobacterium sp. TaxID=1871053 RepID=UPI00391AFEDC